MSATSVRIADASGTEFRSPAIGREVFVITAGSLDAAGTTITQTGLFASYTFNAEDRVVLTAGAGVTKGTYAVASRVDDDSITISTSAGSTSTGDVAGYREGDGDAYLVGDVCSIRQRTNPTAGTLLYRHAVDEIPLIITPDDLPTDRRILLHAIEYYEVGQRQLDGTIQDTTFSFSDGTTNASPGTTITSTGSFASYVWAPGDRLTVSAGTGATVGEYVIAARLSDDAIQVASVGGGAPMTPGVGLSAGDLTGEIYGEGGVRSDDVVTLTISEESGIASGVAGTPLTWVQSVTGEAHRPVREDMGSIGVLAINPGRRLLVTPVVQDSGGVIRERIMFGFIRARYTEV